jgi:hypothetical protein
MGNAEKYKNSSKIISIAILGIKRDAKPPELKGILRKHETKNAREHAPPERPTL